MGLNRCCCELDFLWWPGTEKWSDNMSLKRSALGLSSLFEWKAARLVGDTTGDKRTALLKTLDIRRHDNRNDILGQSVVEQLSLSLVKRMVRRSR